MLLLVITIHAAPAVWPDLTKIHPCDEIFKIYGHLLTAKIVFGNILNIFWQIIYAFEQILMTVNDQILNI